MAHLHGPRVGWEGERLSHYLLSRFSFVAQPTTIADDVGSDFYCTIFEILDGPPPMVEPRTSFAIQIKTTRKKIAAHNKVPYLRDLEIPFFLGTVDQDEGTLEIFSADGFPMMTAVYGYPEKLWLKPVERYEPNRYPWSGPSAKVGVTLECERVCTFKVGETRHDLRPKVDLLLKRCRRTVRNIGARRAEEHFYQLDDDGAKSSLVAGCGSVNYFRDNMYKRLAEAFSNFWYMLAYNTGQFNPAEFTMYENFFHAAATLHHTGTLAIAQARYNDVKALLAEQQALSLAPGA
jgi:hypothetical protein